MLQVRRGWRLTGIHDALQAWTLAAGRTAHAVANLRGIQIELRERAAERVPVHTELFGGLALIALVVSQNFEDVTLFKLPDRVRV